MLNQLSPKLDYWSTGVMMKESISSFNSPILHYSITPLLQDQDLQEFLAFLIVLFVETSSLIEHPDFSALLAEKIVETVLLTGFTGSQDAEIFSRAARVIILHEFIAGQPRLGQ